VFPGFDVPQKCTALSRCKTILLENRVEMERVEAFAMDNELAKQINIRIELLI
jgi:hypothetical protein